MAGEDQERLEFLFLPECVVRLRKVILSEEFVSRRRLSHGWDGTVLCRRSDEKVFFKRYFCERPAMESACVLYVASLLRHPHILPVRRVFSRGLVTYEYGGWIALHEYHQARNVIPAAALPRLFRQMVSAIAYVHHLGMAHGELAASSVVLTEGINCAKLMDFGGKDAATYRGEFRSGDALPVYSAPELVMVEDGVDPQPTDIWALGVILYEMAFGTTPFPGDNFGRVAKAIMRVDIKYPPTPDHGLYNLLRSIFVRDPKKRATAMDLLRNPWVRGAQNPGEPSALFTQTKSVGEVDKTVVDDLVAMGFAMDHVMDSVVDGKKPFSAYIRGGYHVLQSYYAGRQAAEQRRHAVHALLSLVACRPDGCLRFPQAQVARLAPELVEMCLSFLEENVVWGCCPDH